MKRSMKSDFGNVSVVGKSEIPGRCEIRSHGRRGKAVAVLEKALALDGDSCLKLDYGSVDEAKRAAVLLRVTKKRFEADYGSITVVQRGSKVFMIP